MTLLEKWLSFFENANINIDNYSLEDTKPTIKINMLKEWIINKNDFEDYIDWIPVSIKIDNDNFLCYVLYKNINKLSVNFKKFKLLEICPIGYYYEFHDITNEEAEYYL